MGCLAAVSAWLLLWLWPLGCCCTTYLPQPFELRAQGGDEGTLLVDPRRHPRHLRLELLARNERVGESG